MICAVDKSNFVLEDWIWLRISGVETFASTISSTPSLVSTGSASGEGLGSDGAAVAAAFRGTGGLASRAALRFIHHQAPAVRRIARKAPAKASGSMRGLSLAATGGAICGGIFSTPE